MYTNVGKKIKNVVNLFVYCGIAYAIITGISYIAEGAQSDLPILIVLGIVVMVAGSVIAWLLGLLIYGFGQLIENTDIIAGRKQKEPQSESAEDSIEPDAPTVCPNCGAPVNEGTTQCWSCKIRFD